MFKAFGRRFEVLIEFLAPTWLASETFNGCSSSTPIRAKTPVKNDFVLLPLLHTLVTLSKKLLNEKQISFFVLSVTLFKVDVFRARALSYQNAIFISVIHLVL